jgi:hypothetical protein
MRIAAGSRTVLRACCILLEWYCCGRSLVLVSRDNVFSFLAHKSSLCWLYVQIKAQIVAFGTCVCRFFQGSNLQSCECEDPRNLILLLSIRVVVQEL